jgi:predicted enzyme related to lactoylglutathione lyase
MTTSVTGLDFILLPTQDKNRAIAFYRDTLGLELDSEWGEMGAEFKLDGEITLALADTKAINRPFSAHNAGCVALKVADVDAAVKALQAKGVTFEGEIIDSGVCKMAFCSDPDGNSLMLHHRYAP